MRERNWCQYNKELVQRGSLTFLLDPKTLKNLNPKKQKKAGRPLEFSDQLIQILVMIKIHYRLAYRGLEGFTKELLEKLKKIGKMPTYSLICKRAKTLKLPCLSTTKGSVIIVDASGIKIQGEGEWKVKVHGKGRPRKWIKIHVAIDAKTQEILGEIITESTTDDGKAFPELMKQVPGDLDEVIGDGAYDDADVRNLIRERKAKALIPPPKNAVYRGIDEERDRAVLDIRALGGDKIAKSIWSKLSGYSKRALVETAFSRYKKLFGERFFSRTRERQVVENRLKCILLNKMRAQKV